MKKNHQIILVALLLIYFIPQSFAGNSLDITVSGQIAPYYPNAGFFGTPLTGEVPLTVQFTANSTEPLTTFLWDFGDGGTSTEKNPPHIYNSVGMFTVNLTVTGPGGTFSEIKPNYITVTEVPNHPPVAGDEAYSTNQNAQLDVPAPGVLIYDTDPDVGDTLTAAQLSGPSHGTLTLNADGSFTYMPDLNWFGTDTFTYTLSDGNGGSDTGSVTITVNPMYQPPLADHDFYATAEDTPLTIAAPGVLGNDLKLNGGTLTAIPVDQPVHGNLTLHSDGSFTYTPDKNYNGPDTFTYKANDGLADSIPTTVTISIIPRNDPPVALSASYTTREGTSKAITLSFYDIDTSKGFTYDVTQPEFGTLTGTEPYLTYTPIADYHGPDYFTFIVNDSEFDSNTATISINVISDNNPPVAFADTYTTATDTAIDITLAGMDIDGDPLTYSISAEPLYGSLTGTGQNLTYTPGPSYNGSDSFTYTVSDGEGGTDSATVSINVIIGELNHVPVATSLMVETAEDTPDEITLVGSDADIGTELTYSIVIPPEFGTLSGPLPNLLYTPNENYNGFDVFAFRVNDGEFDSNTATVSINVTPVNDPPIAVVDSYITPKQTSIAITLAALDIDGDPLTYSITTQPLHGSLTGTGPNLIYTPGSNYLGSDSFTYTVSDGKGGTATVTIPIAVMEFYKEPIKGGGLAEYFSFEQLQQLEEEEAQPTQAPPEEEKDIEEDEITSDVVITTPVRTVARRIGTVSVYFKFERGNCAELTKVKTQILGEFSNIIRDQITERVESEGHEVNEIPFIVNVWLEPPCTSGNSSLFIMANATWVYEQTGLGLTPENCAQSGIEPGDLVPNVYIVHIDDQGNSELLPVMWVTVCPDEEGNVKLQVDARHLSIYGMVSVKAKEVAGVTPAPGATPEVAPLLVPGGAGIAGAAIMNPLLIIAVAVIIIVFVLVERRYHILSRKEHRVLEHPESGLPAWEHLIETDKQKAYASIIEVLNEIDGQLRDLAETLAKPGIVLVREETEPIVERFFYSCQVVEERIKSHAGKEYLTKEQIEKLNAQLSAAVQRMVELSRQSPILAELVQVRMGSGVAGVGE